MVVATVDNSMEFSEKLKNRATKLPSNYTPCCLSKGVENFCPHKHIHTNIYISCIHNCHNLKAIKMPSVGEWMNKLNIRILL